MNETYGKTNISPVDTELTALIEKEQRDANYYYMLARKAPTPQSCEKLLNLSSEESNHVQSLLASYYLIVGSQYMINRKFIDMHIPFFQSALRKMFHYELKDASDYANLSQHTKDACLAELYQRLAKEEQQHAFLLHKLLTYLL